MRCGFDSRLTGPDVLDVDGNGWSSRYHHLLLSGSAVIKSTIYPGWHSDWLTPWVHYIVSCLTRNQRANLILVKALPS